MYDFLGYYDICYVGGEVRNPGRVIPRSIVYSVLAVAVIYALTNLSLIAVVPWREAVNSKFIAARFHGQAVWTACRIGGDGACVVDRVGVGVRVAVRLQPHPLRGRAEWRLFQDFRAVASRGEFPHVSLLVMGGLSIIACLWTLDDVITALMTSRIIVQFIGQIFAVAIFAQAPARNESAFSYVVVSPPVASSHFLGWTFIFFTSGWKFAGFGLLTLLAGVAAYWIWVRRMR